MPHRGLLIGTLGGERSIWAECLFAGPIGDTVVLDSPDNQELIEESEDYEALLDPLLPFSVSDAQMEGSAQLLSLDGCWFHCKVTR